ncbi:MAG TPA: hypothetical protein VKT78_13500 [Fimbriimonadaceae bacterium]|nr:hypothetical protein [Fimbriimonadaceae bacterium]
MSCLPIQLVSSEDAWNAAKYSRDLLGGLSLFGLAELSTARRMMDAGHYVAGALHRDGYRLLRNGGAPLLQKSWDDWTAEILIRQHGPSRRNTVSPATVDLHVTNHRLAQTRSRYWRASGRGAGHVGSINLGTLICSTAYGAIFNLTHPDSAPMMAMAVSESGTLWIDRASNPGTWDEHSPSPIDSQTTLELLLTYQGWGCAGRFLQDVLQDDAAMSAAVQNYYQRIERGQLACLISDGLPRNLAVVASAYGLL